MQPLTSKFLTGFGPVMKATVNARGHLPSHLLFSEDFAAEDTVRLTATGLVAELACAS